MKDGHELERKRASFIIIVLWVVFVCECVCLCLFLSPSLSRCGSVNNGRPERGRAKVR